MQDAPNWFVALSVLAPIFASFGVLWLSNRHQARLIRDQHDLALEKDKIAAVTSKAGELYSDIQKWKKHLEKSSFDYMIYFRSSSSVNEFLNHITEKKSEHDFDLVRLELNLQSYFRELEPEFRDAHKLVYVVGGIQAGMARAFDKDAEAKMQINGELLTAQREAVAALDAFSAKLAARIHELMEIKRG